MTESDAKTAIRHVIQSLIDGRGEALFMTASADGDPHGTWMATLAIPGSTGELLTVTSAKSRKVQNIEENPKVEWLFTDERKRCLVYLRGEAEILANENAIERGWSALSNKDRAYFLRYSGTDYALVSTRIRSAVLVIPRAVKSYTFPWQEVYATPLPQPTQTAS